jgi:hypothetical protein
MKTILVFFVDAEKLWELWQNGFDREKDRVTPPTLRPPSTDAELVSAFPFLGQDKEGNPKAMICCLWLVGGKIAMAEGILYNG